MPEGWGGINPPSASSLLSICGFARSNHPSGTLCCCGRSHIGRVARAAEKLVNLLGGATFDLFFRSCWYICQVLTLCSGWRRPMLSATLGGHLQTPALQDHAGRTCSGAGVGAQGGSTLLGFPACGAVSRISPSQEQQPGRVLLQCQAGCPGGGCAGCARCSR